MGIAENGHDISEHMTLLHRVFEFIDNREFCLRYSDWLVFARGEEEVSRVAVTNNRPIDEVNVDSLCVRIIDEYLELYDGEWSSYRELMTIVDSLDFCKYCVENGIWYKLVPKKFRSEILYLVSSDDDESETDY